MVNLLSFSFFSFNRRKRFINLSIYVYMKRIIPNIFSDLWFDNLLLLYAFQQKYN